MVEEGSFRSDLYYRLNVFPMTIPPLRERVEDIPALARHFARQCSRRMGRQAPSIPEEPMDALKQWNWPGNIRELQNVIERAVILSGSTLVLPLQDVQPSVRRTASSAKPDKTFNEAEREAILRALRDSGGVIAGPAARRAPRAQADDAALEDAAPVFSGPPSEHVRAEPASYSSESALPGNTGISFRHSLTGCVRHGIRVSRFHTRVALWFMKSGQ